MRMYGRDAVLPTVRAVLMDADGVVPLLADAMIAAHLTGRRRTELQVAPRFVPRTRTFATTYEGTIDFLARRIDATGTEIELLRRTYTDEALRVTREASEFLEKELQEAIVETVLDGGGVKEGVKGLRDAFQRAGYAPEADYRLEAIFRTQTQTAYSAGRVNAWRDPAIDEILWGFEFTAVADDRTTELCQGLDGTRRPKSDPLWVQCTPPLHWNCRSTLIEIFNDEKLAVPTDLPANVTPQAGFNFNPGDVYRDLIGRRKAA